MKSTKNAYKNINYWTYGGGGFAHYSNSLIFTKLKAVLFCLKYNKPSYIETPTGDPDNSYKNIKTYNLRKLRKIISFLRLIFYLPVLIAVVVWWALLIYIVWFLDRKSSDLNFKKEMLSISKFMLKSHDSTIFYLTLCIWWFGIILPWYWGLLN